MFEKSSCRSEAGVHQEERSDSGDVEDQASSGSKQCQSGREKRNIGKLKGLNNVICKDNIHAAVIIAYYCGC